MLLLDFQKHFAALEDPRVTNHNTRHKFMDILVMAFIGTLCGCDDWTEVVDFCTLKKQLFKQFLELPNGIPSCNTFARVFSMIDIKHFEELFIDCMNEVFIKTRGEVVALDGKTIRAARESGTKKGIHLVNAWACENNLTLGTMRVDDQTNEITVVPKLLKLLNISHCTVTLDAMGCQRDIAETIINKKAHYVLTVKGNQTALKTELEMTFKLLNMKPNESFLDSGDEVEKGHGRTETRRYISIPISKCSNITNDWLGAQSITGVIRKRLVNGETSEQTSYFISSHPYHSPDIKKAIRSHWKVENNLHWQLDVSFNEDRSRARMKNEAESIALLRRMTMAVLKKDIQSKSSIKCKRKKAGWDDTYLCEVIALMTGSQPCELKITSTQDWQ